MFVVCCQPSPLSNNIQNFNFRYKIFPIMISSVLDFDHNSIHYRARNPNLSPRPGLGGGPGGHSSYYSVCEAPGPAQVRLTPVTPDTVDTWSVRPPPGHPGHQDTSGNKRDASDNHFITNWINVKRKLMKPYEPLQCPVPRAWRILCCSLCCSSSPTSPRGPPSSPSCTPGPSSRVSTSAS